VLNHLFVRYSCNTKACFWCTRLRLAQNFIWTTIYWLEWSERVEHWMYLATCWLTFFLFFMKPWILLDHSCWAYPQFLQHEAARSISTPPGRDLVHCRSFPCNLLGFPNNLLVPIYTPGWREALWELSVLPKNTTQCPRPGLEPGLLAPGTSAL